MNETIYRTFEEPKDGYGTTTKYHSRAASALEEIKTEIWSATSKYIGQKTISVFVPKGFSLDESEFQVIVQRFISAYHVLYTNNSRHSSSELKSLSKEYGDLLSAIPLVLNEPNLIPGNELIVKIQAGKKKASYSDPLAIVKGVINNSDRMDKFFILERNGTYLPNFRAVEDLLQSCVDEAKHWQRWSGDHSYYDMKTVHARQDFDKALAKKKAAELKSLLIL